MWIFLSDAFLSVVADKDDPSGPRLLVRARRQGDIERVFPETEVASTPGADYRFRAWLPRERVAAVLTQLVESLVTPTSRARSTTTPTTMPPWARGA